MDEMDSKLDTKERGLASEMVKARQPKSIRAPLLEGLDLLKHQILELPITFGGVEFNTGQVRDKLRHKYRKEKTLADRIKTATEELAEVGLLHIVQQEAKRSGRKVVVTQKKSLADVDGNAEASAERARLYVSKSVFP